MTQRLLLALITFALANPLSAQATVNGDMPMAVNAAKSFPAVKQALDSFIVRNEIADASTARIHLIVPHRTVFGTISVIGDDCLLFEMHGDMKNDPADAPKRRRIIPKSAIASIELDANPLRFHYAVPRSQNQTGG